MPHPTASAFGPRRKVGFALAPSQLQKLMEARAAGWSNQQVVTQGLPLVSEVGANPSAGSKAEGTARKLVVIRLAPELVADVQGTCERLRCTYGQLVEACAQGLLNTKTIKNNTA